MTVSFIKTSPTQNMTVLVTSPVEKSLQDTIGKKLMQYDHVNAEQVGFLEPTTQDKAWVRLCMLGGFCGNGVLSAAAVAARDRQIPVGSCVEVPVEAAEAPDTLLNCRVIVEDGYCLCALHMPDPLEVTVTPFVPDGCICALPLVHFPGISHVICNPSALLTPQDPEAFTQALFKRIADFTPNDTIGIMFYDGHFLRPYVYTAPANCRVWERGCGSGSSAVGAYLATLHQRDVDIQLPQPGGTIGVQAAYNRGGVPHIVVEGRVYIVAEGNAYL